MKVFKKRLEDVMRHPSVIKDIVQGKPKEEIRAKIHQLDDANGEREVLSFVDHIRRNSPYNVDPTKPLKLCCIEDWQNKEFQEALSAFPTPRHGGFIHRKRWEWATGLIAMQRFGKLNSKCNALGVGAGTESMLFYLANHLAHVYATDLYAGKEWKEAPADFLADPKKYSPIKYKEDALTALRMDGTKLEFPSDSFDLVFSFSSIEHFKRGNPLGAIQSLKEIERVLRPGGIAVLTTEYILNGKQHEEFFNQNTIYSEFIDCVKMKLVEPLDVRITTNTLNTLMSFFTSEKWFDMDDEYRKTHRVILLRLYSIVYTSVMLVFQK
jgi:SAM-dependent methyltransferase